MKYKTEQLIADGKTYATVMDFCEHFGFKYTSVKYHMRQGKNGDEIVAALRRNSLKRRYSSKPGRGKPVMIDNVQYGSVAEASEAYGIPTHQVYTLAKEERISHEAAINKLVSRRFGHTVPCTISGVTYPSREAAAKAYSLPMQTIRARMARHGLSFEDAILKGSRERLLMTAEKTKWSDLDLKEIGSEDIQKNTKSMLYLVTTALETNNYPVKCFCDHTKNIWAVRFRESMEVGDELLDVYLLFDNDNPSRDLEIIIPAAGKIKSLTAKERKTLLEQINSLNNTYTGAKISLSENRISMNWSVTTGGTKTAITALMRMIYRFIGTAGVLWKETCWAMQF